MLLVIFDIALLCIYKVIYKEWINPGFFCILMWLASHVLLLFNIIDYGILPRYYFAYAIYMLFFLMVTSTLKGVTRGSGKCKTVIMNVNDEKLNIIINVLIGLNFLGILNSAKSKSFTFDTLFNFNELNTMRYGNLGTFTVYTQALRYLIFPLTIMFTLYYEHITMKRMKIIFLIALIIMFDLTQLSKVAIVNCPILFMIVYLNKIKFMGKKIERKPIILIAIVAILAIIGFFFIQSIRHYKSISIANLKKTIENVYVYFTCGIPGFDYVCKVDYSEKYYFGLASFAAFYEKIFQEVNFKISPPVSKGNFYTGFREMYLDFKEFGFVIYPLIYGGLSYICYIKGVLNKKPMSFIILIFMEWIFCGMTVIMLTVQQFFFYSFGIMIILTIFLYKCKIVRVVFK